MLVVTTAGSLTLLGGVLVSAASADTTPSPTPSASPKPTVNPLDAQVNDESDALELVGGNQVGQNMINDQVTEDSTSNDGEGQDENSSVQENDNEVDDLNAENQQEEDSFTQDINSAEQDGDHDDAVELIAAAAIVTTVTAPEVQAISNDDSQAQAIIVGTSTK